MTVKVAIAGAGMVGSYLCRLLDTKGIEADLYDERKGHAACGINPCAWGSTSRFRDCMRAAQLDPEKYVLRDFSVVNFEGVDMRASLITFDKPRLVRDLQADKNILRGQIPRHQYERVIDATGVRRSYLPAVKDDLLVPCVQHRVIAEGVDSSKVVIQYGNLGYAWRFPLSDTEFHIGAGSLLADPNETLRDSGFLNIGGKVRCSCSGSVRSTSPRKSQPFVSKDESLASEIWGVGESIGAVAPIAGEGVAPGMDSARILVNCWDDPRSYTSKILKEFSWMMGERRVIGKVARSESLNLRDWLTLRKTGLRMGSSVTVSETREILKCLTKPQACNRRENTSAQSECAK